MKFKLFFFSLLFPIVLLAQTELTEKQINEDYAIFKNVLTSAHPSLYEYTTQHQWDSIFANFEKTTQQLKNTGDLFKSISAMASNSKDGHLVVSHPKIENIPPMFPLLIKIIDGKLYTDTEDFGVPVGSEVMMIDSMGSKELLNKMLKYSSADGYNLTKKYRQIEAEFGILLYYEFGAQPHYIVTYHAPGGEEIQTIKIQSQPFESIGARNPNRNSYFSIYQKKADKTKYFLNTIYEKWPFVYFIDSVNTAVLTVNSFALDPQEFKAKLIDIFDEIKKKKADHLIIDVRQNNGGFRINAIHLFSFITEKPFKQRTSEIAIASTLPEQRYIIHTLSDYDEFLKTYFNGSKKNDRYVLYTDKAEEMMKPYKKSFKGKTYVLTGGKTFSAGVEFALNAKNDPSITIVGEETGGGYYFHTGQFPALYELPNSKILFSISLVKINHHVLDTTLPKGSGIKPDIEIELSRQDLIKGKDRQLDDVLKQIKEK